VDIKSCTDAELVQKMFPRPGTTGLELEDAWQEFISRFEVILIKAIRLTCRRFAPQNRLTHEDVSDLVQQIFLKLSENDYKALRELICDKPNSVKLYLYAVASNTVLDCLRYAQTARRQSCRNELEYEDERLQSERLYSRDANPEEQYLHKELIELILKIVDGESDEKTRARNRLIFMLAHSEGYTRSEIAAQQEIDLTRTGVNSFFYRVKKRLADIYNPPDLDTTAGR
jgi:RNA polymerase sigma factor (sigma-70 family)